jgi:hypothetical protein
VTLLESLQTLDIQHNKINDVNILEIVSSLKDLRVLYLIGNPVIKSIKHYRKTIIAKCKSLKYLDDRPVFDEERRRVEAWMAVYEIDNNTDAANEAERLELKLIRKEKDDIDEKNFKAFEALMNSGKEIKRLRELELLQSQSSGLPPTPDVNPFTGESIIDGCKCMTLCVYVYIYMYVYICRNIHIHIIYRNTYLKICTYTYFTCIHEYHVHMYINVNTGETIINVPESEILRELREKRWNNISQKPTEGMEMNIYISLLINTFICISIYLYR